MKKLLIILLLVITGCAVPAPSLYEEEVTEKKDIEGDFNERSMDIYGDRGLFANFIVKFISRERDSSNYLIELRYVGRDYLGVNQMRIKTDDNLYTLIDNNPLTDVTLGADHETIARFNLNQEQVEDIKNSQSLSLQWLEDDRVDLPSEAMSAIKTFID